MNNQSKKSVCCESELSYSGGCGFCTKCGKNQDYKLPHSSQDLEGETPNQKLKNAIEQADIAKEVFDAVGHSKPVSEEKCGVELEMEGGFYMYCQLPKDGHVIHDSKPVSEGKEIFDCFKFQCEISADGIHHHPACKYNVDTPPSNALRSEEENNKEFIDNLNFATGNILTEHQWKLVLVIIQGRVLDARADERKKMGELIKKFCESKSWKEDAGNEVVQLEDILDYLSKLVKPQDK